jgi:F0F1-type ATP synthase delta subunit
METILQQVVQVAALLLMLIQLAQMEMLEGIIQQKDKRAETQTLLQVVQVAVAVDLHRKALTKVKI